MRVVCISDTHGLHAALQEVSPIPPGDVLVHAGDFTDTGARDEVLAFNTWLATLPHKYKIVIAGNHESTFDCAFYPHNWHNYGHEQRYDPTEVRALLTNALYLEDQAVLIDGFLFYGSPWQPEFCNWAFNLPRGDKLVQKWKMIPSDVDVLVTHTPPMGRGDQVGHLRVGCSDLLHEVQTRIKPPFHVFGHVHEGYGRTSDGVTTFLNASCCTHEYEAVNAPMVINLRKPRTIHDLEKNHAIRYDIMLHEQLRICSQKPAFVPNVRSSTMNGKTVVEANGRKSSLKEFSVDGTTAALLFESTLKLRPVKGQQTRALRYLFHHGFKGAEGENSAIGGGQVDEEEGALEDSGEAGSTDGGMRANGAEDRVRERRRLSLSRRVTMAVLEELPNATRDAIAPTPEALMTASSIEISTITTTTGPVTTVGAAKNPPRRARRDKTLHRREAVAKLATMVEEPEKEAAAAAEVDTSTAPSATPASEMSPEPAEVQTPSSTSASIETKLLIESPHDPPAPSAPAAEPPSAPVQECIMCKYKVAGHVHPGSNGSSSATPPPSIAPSKPTPTPPPTERNVVPQEGTISGSAGAIDIVAPPVAPPIECIMCKYKVAGHVHPGAELAPAETTESEQEAEGEDEEEDSTSTTSGRNRPVGPKRLSSWF